MAEQTGSTVPGRLLGLALRELRTEARMTLDGAAEALQHSGRKLWRIEAGVAPPRRAEVEAMCELYDAPPELAATLVGLAGQAYAKGWWHAYDDVAGADDLLRRLEATASRLRLYGDAAVPDLLQTAGYAHEMSRQRRMPEPERARLPRVWQRRGELLWRQLPPPPRVEVLLSEMVLLRPVGGAAAMASQLARLLELGRLPHVSVRVVPLNAGPHAAATTGAFTILDFAGVSRVAPEPSVVHWRLLTGAMYLDRPEELAVYNRIWDGIEALALDTEQSERLITKLADGL